MSGVETYVEIHDGAWGNFKGWATIDSARVGGYDWEEFRVMRGPDGRLYVGSSSGCSCNDFDTNVEPADLTPAEGWQDALHRLNKWAEPEYEWDTDRQTAATELRSRLAQSRPRKRIAHDVRKGFQS
jgi:hypothetical protein